MLRVNEDQPNSHDNGGDGGEGSGGGYCGR